MVKEYRFPLDEEIYELPAGLIDPGRDTQDGGCPRTEKEETGFILQSMKAESLSSASRSVSFPAFQMRQERRIFRYADDLDGQKDMKLQVDC